MKAPSTEEKEQTIHERIVVPEQIGPIYEVERCNTIRQETNHKT
jgi:hypothetical protein